jgi:hypothetical protein
MLNKTAFGGPVVVALAAIQGSGHQGFCQSLASTRCRGAPGIGRGRHTDANCFHLDNKLQAALMQLSQPRLSTYAHATRQLIDILDSYKPSPQRIIFQCNHGNGRRMALPFMGNFPDAWAASMLTSKTDRQFVGITTSRLDLHTLALHAERHGIDFRVVHLRRDPVLCILSRAKVLAASNSAVSLDALTQTALDNEIVLRSQLQRLDPAFTFELDHRTGREQATALAQFLGVPALAANFVQVWQSDVDSDVRQKHVSHAALTAFVHKLWEGSANFPPSPPTLARQTHNFRRTVPGNSQNLLELATQSVPGLRMG